MNEANKNQKNLRRTEENDGYRILVDRLWPRGIKKDEAKIDEWMREIAPSDNLRKWFHHEPGKWASFKRKYIKELENKEDLTGRLKKISRTKTITLLYSAKDMLHNQALALKEYMSDLNGTLIMDNLISKDIIKNAFEYESYKKFLEEGLSSHPPYYKTDKLSEFTKLNLSRMKRIEKSIKLDDEISKKISSLNKNIILFVITEGWCGDVAQNLPVIYLMANKNQKIELKIILRDKHPEIMDTFLTNGTRSIPVVVILDKNTFSILGKWGPRPVPAQEIIVQWKKRKDYDHDKAVKDIQLWYLEDAGLTIQKEFSSLFDKIAQS